MFGKKNKRVTRIDSLVGQETEINGDIFFSGGLHIDGKVKGNVIANRDSTSVLTLSEQGRVEGEIHVPNVILNGHVEGNVHTSEHIELALNARINGNVYYNLIEMAMGAAVNGSLVHVDPQQLQEKNQQKQLEHQAAKLDESEKAETTATGSG